MLKIGQRNGVVFAEGSIGNLRPHVFVYVVDGMLIDTGPQKLEAELAEFYTSQDFNQVVLTHSHEDHSGTAAWMRERGVPVYLWESGIDACKEEADYPQYRQDMWGLRQPFAAVPLKNTVVSDTTVWDVVHTPGHSPNHVCLLNQDTGTLFSGDLYLSTKVKVLMKDESVPVMMQSIRKVLSLDFEDLYCSHAGYVPEGRQHLKRKLVFMEELSGEILQLYHKGWTISEIDKQMFPQKPPIVAYSAGEFDTVHIVSSVVENA
ncbi:MBL fold metallo-hydrolase [Alicyclobacillus sp. SO9]|uniref:MBL fold metallo-hydrolase n=1 Tax=Alicyclobacillus sp. SO9 TaxID=2665646 RepID=UPI0018E8115D|nr:MBL fold metallo-hydrolase [Alicyclobacillus sp. SO9]QQE79133.1 MBL fold metallo-hydrolase [Alicyclobacillus sp. SO9]